MPRSTESFSPPGDAGQSKGFFSGLIPYLVLVFATTIICSLRYFQLLTGRFGFGSPIHVRHLEPTIGFFKDSIATGKLPAWNPHCYLGMPQLPDCFPGNFYPLNLLFLIPNYDYACLAFLLVHQVIGVVGICVAASQLGLKDMMSRMVAGVLYLLVCICLCGDENLALCAVLAWLPFCVFGLIKCLGVGSTEGGLKPHPGGLIVVNAIFLALMMVAGATIVVSTVVILLVSVLVIRLILFKMNKAKQFHRPALTLYLVSVVFAFCLASPVLLPTLEWASGPVTSMSGFCSPVQFIENLMRSCPNRVSFKCLFLGPETVSHESRNQLALKSDAMMKAISSVAAHQGRYLMILPETEMPDAEDSIVCRSMLPNRNLKYRMSSSLGYLGHPSNAYRDLVANALKGDPCSGFTLAPTDLKSSSKLLYFCRVTSTGVLVSSDWPNKGHAKIGFNDWRPYSEPFKQEPETWHLLQQTVTTPIAYSCDAWHWLDSRDEFFTRAFAVKDQFDPRLLTFVEKADQIEIDTEKLDKIPLVEGNPPGGPPLTDSPKVEIAQNVTHIKPVEVLVYEPEHISLSVRAAKPSFIVLNETYYPGWKAYVDGVPAPCFRANGFARAVFVQAGSHLVGFDFRSESLKLGGMLSVASFCLLILLSFYWLWQLLGKTVRLMSYGRFE
ncbi:MAG: hypothetical protein SGJ27_20515 [Candidatus Melainabacteria bacterium]|nr:hypothetical protein [Candidatus Melainabacteria bacterium]